MFHNTLESISAFEAGDKTQIKEILHPKNDPIDLNYSLAHASLGPQEASIPHILEECSETYFILKGSGKVMIDEEQQVVKKGDTVFIPKGAIQYIENLSDEPLEFLCIVSPPWYAEQERIL